MRISIAQIRTTAGDVQKNIKLHLRFINFALKHKADFIIFPELSLSGYEPTLAKGLAVSKDALEFRDIQKICDQMAITVGAGMPILSTDGIYIGMIIFCPGKPTSVYCKQQLHSDELPYFTNGKDELFIDIADQKIAPAICYESLLPEHSEKAHKNGASMYIASVAKSVRGIEKAFKHYPEIAKNYSIPVFMANAIGPCDDFVSGGQSSIWGPDGQLLAQLSSDVEGILVYDFSTGETTRNILH